MTNYGGIGSGIDVNSIVSSIMEVEKLNVNRLSKTRNQYDVQLNAYKNFETLLKNFSQSLDQLTPLIRNDTYTISSSDSSVLNASLTSNKVSPGQYNINITQLAQAHQMASSVFTASNEALNLTSTLSIQSGSNNFSLNLSPTDTLEKVRDSINNSHSGLSAAILSTTSDLGTPEFRLIITSQQTGVVNEMQFSGDAASDLGLTNELTAAQDAVFTFNGFNAVRSSNTVSDLIDGLSFTLNSANKSATISVNPDNNNKNQNIKSALHDLIDNYNSIIDLINKNESMSNLRDSTYSLVKARLENTMNRALGNSSVKNLFDIGVQTAPWAESINDNGIKYIQSGKLMIDDTILSSALSDNFADIATFITDSSAGFVTTFKSLLYDVSKEGGNISSREKSIREQEARIDEKINKEESRLEFVKDKLFKQYSDLNTFIQKYQQISKFLENQLSMLNKD